MRVVAALPSLDADRQAVRIPRQRAGGVWREDARRVVGAVEVDNDPTVGVGRIGVEISAACIGLETIRGVAEDEPQLAGVASRHGLEPMRLPVDLEDEVTG